jgi:hypothetical protein
LRFCASGQMTAKIAAAVINARISHRVITLVYQIITDAGGMRHARQSPSASCEALLARIHRAVAD